jgi:hypothetical protein
VTPSSDDEQPRLPLRLLNSIVTPDLALAVEGLRIHEHEESFPSEEEDDADDEDEDISIPPSEGSSLEDDGNDDLGESSDDEETILAPRTMASLGQPISDEALRARCLPRKTCLILVFQPYLSPKTPALSMNFLPHGVLQHKDRWE